MAVRWFNIEHDWKSPHLPFAVEAKDLKADAGGATGLDLVEVSEEVEPGSPPSIVQLPLRQDPQQGGLPRVHVSQDGDPQVQELKSGPEAIYESQVWGCHSQQNTWDNPME